MHINVLPALADRSIAFRTTFIALVAPHVLAEVVWLSTSWLNMMWRCSSALRNSLASKWSCTRTRNLRYDILIAVLYLSYRFSYYNSNHYHRKNIIRPPAFYLYLLLACIVSVIFQALVFLERVTEAQRIALQKLKELEEGAEDTYSKKRAVKKAKVFDTSLVIWRRHHCCTTSSCTTDLPYHS